MISTPRLLEYEKLIVDFALDLLDYYGKDTLYKRTTRLDDELRLSSITGDDYRLQTVLRYNIERKKIHEKHIKFLKVLRAILERISIERRNFSRACFTRVAGVEEFDTDDEVFKRRMGMRQYFKELRMNMARIERSKEMKSGERKKEKEEKKRAKKDGEEKSPEKGGAKSAKGKAAGGSALGKSATGKKKIVKK